ncbi:MAG: 4Fe-4S dicluster domain-containing protein, partial [Desulfurococcaceae archaeon]
KALCNLKAMQVLHDKRKLQAHSSSGIRRCQAIINLLSSELKKCIQCGTCTSACVVSRVTGKFNPRLIIYRLRRGNAPIGEEAWLCLRCHTCESRCPNAVRVPDIIGHLREASLERGDEKRVVELYLDLAETMFEEGITMPPISQEVREFKSEGGLEFQPLPPDFKVELKALLKEVGFEDRLKKVMSRGEGRG